MIPLYGFLQGDTIGLLVLASPDDSMAVLCAKLQAAARARVRAQNNPVAVYANRTLPAGATVADVGMLPLDRFDVRFDVRFDAKGSE